MVLQTAISVEEFLAMPDTGLSEYIDGEIVERPLSTKPHSRALLNLSFYFRRDENSSHLYAYPTQHIPATASRYRVPDFVAYADSVPEGDYPSVPPLEGCWPNGRI